MSYTKATESKSVPRIFVKLTKLDDTQCNNVVTSGEVPTSGWNQLNTLGGATYSFNRATTDLENDQQGIVNVVLDKQDSELKIVLSSFGLSALENLYKVNMGGTGTIDKDQRGISLLDKGLSFLIYDKNEDASNETDIPDVTTDSNTWVIFNAVPTGSITMALNGSQNTAELTFRPLPNQGTGSAKGIRAKFGAFTAAS